MTETLIQSDGAFPRTMSTDDTPGPSDEEKDSARSHWHAAQVEEELVPVTLPLPIAAPDDAWGTSFWVCRSSGKGKCALYARRANAPPKSL